MRIEVGKTYRTRSGKVFTMDREHLNCIWSGPNGWSHAGNYWNGLGSQEDMQLVMEEPSKSTIPHADLIRAVLDGKTVQWRACGKDRNGDWIDYDSEMLNTVEDLARAVRLNRGDYAFRIKPDPIRFTIELTKTIVVEIIADTEDEALTAAVDPDQTWDGAWDAAHPQVVDVLNREEA